MLHSNGARRNQRLYRRAILCLVPAASVIGACFWVFALVFDAAPPAIIWLLYAGSDAVIVLALAFLLAKLQRPNLLGASLAVAIPSGLLLASSAKLLVLGTPASFEDAFFIPDLWETLPLWQQNVIAGLAVAAVAAFVLNLGHPRRMAVGLTPIGAFSIMLMSPTIHPAFAFSTEWLPRRTGDFPFYGHFVGAVLVRLEENELSRWVSLADGAEDQRGAWTIHDGLPPSIRIRPRNVHLVLVESLMDPLSLRAIAWPNEPLSGLFSRWRQEAAGKAVSPVFGNRSSNAEFEALCGLPSSESASAMVFTRIRPGTRLECLPYHLGIHGYATLSLVPSSPTIFGAGRAFPAMGFAQSLFAPDLVMSDLDGVWLSAEATLTQAIERVESLRATAQSRPVFSYTFVNAGHFPFERDRRERPDPVMPAPIPQMVHDWASATHYNAVAIENFVQYINASDPDALIVVLGDHQPPLGANFEGYRVGGRIKPADTLAPLRRARMYETPLIIVDGGRLRDVGRTPTWQIPEIILDILSDGKMCAEIACAHKASWRLRPFYDFVLRVEANGDGEEVCEMLQPQPERNSAACDVAVQQARALRTRLARLLRPAPSR